MQAARFKSFMSEALAEVLEAMCFMSPDGEAAAGMVDCEAGCVCGELDFTGSQSGSFGIAVTPATADAIAANFLGDDESALSEQQTSEVIGELTNMVCGSLLSQCNPKEAFTLSPPRPECSGARGLPAAEERIDCTFALEEGFIYTWLEIRART